MTRAKLLDSPVVDPERILSLGMAAVALQHQQERTNPDRLRAIARALRQRADKFDEAAAVFERARAQGFVPRPVAFVQPPMGHHQHTRTDVTTCPDCGAVVHYLAKHKRFCKGATV